MSDSTVRSPPSGAEYSQSVVRGFNLTSVITVATPNVVVPVPILGISEGPYATGLLFKKHNFDLDSNGELVYTGKDNIAVRCTANFSMKSESTTQLVRFGFIANRDQGTFTSPQGLIFNLLPTNYQVINVETVFPIKPLDKIGLYIRVDTTAVDVGIRIGTTLIDSFLVPSPGAS